MSDFLYLIIGALLLAVVALAFLAWHAGRNRHLCEVCFDNDAAARVCRPCANRAAGL